MKGTFSKTTLKIGDEIDSIKMPAHEDILYVQIGGLDTLIVWYFKYSNC